MEEVTQYKDQETLSTSYNLRFQRYSPQFQGRYRKVKGQIKVSEILPGQDFKGHYCKIKNHIKVISLCSTPTPLNQCHSQVSSSYTLLFQHHSLDKIFTSQGHYSKVKGQIKVTS